MNFRKILRTSYGVRFPYYNDYQNYQPKHKIEQENILATFRCFHMYVSLYLQNCFQKIQECLDDLDRIEFKYSPFLSHSKCLIPYWQLLL